MKLRVGVFDPFPLLSAGIARVLEHGNEACVARIGLTAHDALKSVAEDNLDVVILGIDNSDLFSLINRFSRLNVPVVALSPRDDINVCVESIGAGARAFLLKSSSEYELQDAVTSVGSGGDYISPALAAKAVQFLHRRPSVSGKYVYLTKKEEQTALLLRQGLSNSKIGQTLGINPGAVKYRISRLMFKLGVKNRTSVALLLQNPQAVQIRNSRLEELPREVEPT